MSKEAQIKTQVVIEALAKDDLNYFLTLIDDLIIPNNQKSNFLVDSALKYGAVKCLKYIFKNNKLLEKAIEANITKKIGVDLTSNGVNGNKVALKEYSNISISEVTFYLAKGFDVNEDLLIERKVASGKIVTEQKTFLHLAAMNNDPELIKILLREGANVNSIDSYGSPAIFRAIWGKDLEMVKLLLNDSFKIDLLNNDQDTALLLAAECGAKSKSALDEGKCKSIISLLLSKGADFNLQSKEGITVLHYAALKGWNDIVENLIEKNANVNVQDIYLMTPLFCTIMMDDLETFEIFLKTKADVNIKNIKGDTLLHYAALRGSKVAIEQLLDKGAIIVKNNDGKTPLDLAIENNVSKNIQVLLKPYVDTSETNMQEEYLNTPNHATHEEENDLNTAQLTGQMFQLKFHEDIGALMD